MPEMSELMKIFMAYCPAGKRRCRLPLPMQRFGRPSRPGPRALFGDCLRRGGRILDQVKHKTAHPLRAPELHEQPLFFVREGNTGTFAMTTISSVMPGAKSDQNPNELGPSMPTTAFLQ